MTAVHPLMVSLLTAGMLLAFRKNRWAMRLLSLAGGLVHLGISIQLFREPSGMLQLGSWPAPFGISFLADRFATMMVLVASIIGLAVLITSWIDVESREEKLGFHPMVHVLMTGVCGAFLTHDLFNLFVWFEVMLMASFVLLGLGEKRGQVSGALRYFALNLVSSLFFLSAVGLLYGWLGTLQMSDIAIRLAQTEERGLLLGIGALLFLAFAIKAALFPVFAWLPVSYPMPSFGVSALFAGLLTKVGVVAMVRFYCLLPADSTLQSFIIFAGLATMVVGVLCAIGQSTIRRILSFHIVSQVGYMVLALGLFNGLGLTACLFYLIHHILVKANLFLVGGIVHRIQGSEKVQECGGLASAYPWLAFLFWIPALSLAGLPPLSGFWAKLLVIRTGLDQENFLAVGVALAVGLLTLLSMIKIWNEVFWKPLPERTEPPPSRRTLAILAAPSVALGLLTVLLGVFAQTGIEWSEQAARELRPQVVLMEESAE